MQLRHYTPDVADALARSYNSMVGGVPYCYPTSAEIWSSFLEPLVCPSYKPEALFHGGVDNQELLTAWDCGELVGLSHALVESVPSSGAQTEGTIAFLCYRRGLRAAGQLLLEGSERYLRSRGAHVVKAFPGAHRYPFYHVETAYLSSRLEHVQALLGLNGYSRDRGLGILERRNFVASIPARRDAYGETELETANGGAERWCFRLKAVSGGRVLGTCEAGPLEFYGSLCPKNQWLFVRWLGVEQDQQGNRLGLHLLEKTLEEMGSLGFRNAVIGVDQGNDIALSMYSNHGFRLTDWTYSFAKDLSLDA